jgi:hypothetical protein
MSGTQANARIWSQVDVSVAPVGTTAPTTVAAALDAAFDLVGFLDEDAGVEFNPARSVSDHFAYGGALLRTGVKGEKHSFKFMALEDNPIVEGLVNPGGTISTTSGVSTVNLCNYVPNPKAWVVEFTDGDVGERIIIPNGEVVEAVDAQKYTDDGILMLGLTVTCYADGNGVWGVKVSTNPALAG